MLWFKIGEWWYFELFLNFLVYIKVVEIILRFSNWLIVGGDGENGLLYSGFFF